MNTLAKTKTPRAKSLAVNAVLFAAAIALPFIMRSMQQDYIIHVLCLIEIYVILALGLNVIIGFTGILNLGFAAFYGIGAYTAALFAIHTNLPFWLILPLSGISAAVAGGLICIPILRLRGDYIAIVTLGFVEIVRLALNNMDFLTNGPKGLPGINQTINPPALNIFGKTIFTLGDDFAFYFFILALVVLTIIFMLWLHRSRPGRELVAIREDEIAAQAMGVNTTAMKIFAFTVGTFFAGLAGCVYTYWIGFITPELFTFWESVLIVCMIVLGGMGSVPGVVLGAVLIAGIPELLRGLLQTASEDFPASMKQFFDNMILARYLLFGVIMVIVVIFRSQGIMPAKRPPLRGGRRR